MVRLGPVQQLPSELPSELRKVKLQRHGPLSLVGSPSSRLKPTHGDAKAIDLFLHAS